MPSLSSPIISACSSTSFPISSTCWPMVESSAPGPKDWPSNWKSAAMTGFSKANFSRRDAVPVDRGMIDAPISDAMKETDPYLLEFERFDKPDSAHPSWLYPIRKAGLARFAELGFPTTKDEDWRFTNVSPIAKLPVELSLDPADHHLKAADLAQFN